MIDTTKAIVELDGTAIPGKDGSLILRTVLCNALLGNVQEPLSGEAHLIRYNLALRIHENDSITLTSEETVLCKECVAKMYTPLIVGQVFYTLEPVLATRGED